MELHQGGLLKLYTEMVRARAFEELVVSLVARGKIRAGWMSGIGQEAIVGAISFLRPDDYITYTHRGVYYFLARGMEPEVLLAELYGKRTGCCKGKGGRHIADVARGIFGKSGTVGGHPPIAVGLAIAAQMRGKGQVVVSFFGDGCSNRGTLHEAMNMASVWKLPIVWVCENNGYFGVTPVSMSTAAKDIADLAGSYAMPGTVIDGNDVVAVCLATREGVARAREGLGPCLIELKTYRIREHMESDPGGYRSPEEVEEWVRKDPIQRLQQRLLAEGVLTSEAVARIHREAEAEMRQAQQFAEESPFPSPEEAFQDLYA